MAENEYPAYHAAINLAQLIKRERELRNNLEKAEEEINRNLHEQQEVMEELNEAILQG